MDRANASAPSPTNRMCEVSVITRRAREMGLRTDRTQPTAPHARVRPSIIEASNSNWPAAFDCAPWPALKACESSSSRIASSTASSARPPAVSISLPALRASDSPRRRTWAWSGDAGGRPAPPCSAMAYWSFGGDTFGRVRHEVVEMNGREKSAVPRRSIDLRVEATMSLRELQTFGPSQSPL